MGYILVLVQIWDPRSQLNIHWKSGYIELTITK